MLIAVVAACPFPCPRGTPIRILRLSEALAAAGHTVHVVTYHFGSGEVPDLPNLHVHRIADVPSYRKLDPGPSWHKLFVLDPMLVRKLGELLRSESVDLIHAHHYEGLLTAKLANRGMTTPLVYDAHTLLASELPFYSPASPQALKAALGRTLDRRVPGLADGVICVTEEIEQRLAGQVRSPEHIITIPNGVELDAFSVKRRFPPQDQGEQHDTKTVIYAGTLANYQGIGLMLESFAGVAERLERARFKIVSHDNFDSYWPLAQRLGIDDKLEVSSASLAELGPLIARADVAVNPRIQGDGLPQKNLNYLAAGVPIVCFEGSSKHLRHGDTARIVSDGNVEQFASAIAEVLSNPVAAREMGARGRAYVEENCSWELAAQTAASFFQDMIGEAEVRQGSR